MFNRMKIPQIFLLPASAISIGLFVVFSLGTLQPMFGPREDRGPLENPHIDEASGLAASRVNPELLWVHNDSGKKARLFAINTRGANVATFFLPGTRYRDWEDIAVGPGPDSTQSYIYVGDIGDNDAKYDTKYIYRFPEPLLSQVRIPLADTIRSVEVIAFRYPDGRRDAETLLVDPLSRDLFIVSKREEQARVYRLPYPQSTAEVTTAQKVATLSFSGMVGGDISPSGGEILLKNYDTVFYWKRDPEQAVAAALQVEPLVVPYVLEPQGEAICWDYLGLGYFTTSEEPAHLEAHLYYYPRLAVSATGRPE